MAGIKRIRILSDWNNKRLEMSRALSPAADNLYFEVFENLSMPLMAGVETIECTKEDAVSRYDYQEGIDVILYFQSGHKATMQEKFLDYHKSTVTFTEHQKNGKPGNWYTCTAQYWFTGYARLWKSYGICSFQDWMLLDLPGLHRFDSSETLPWKFNENKIAGYIGIGFRYLLFNLVPPSVVVARMEEEQDQLDFAYLTEEDW